MKTIAFIDTGLAGHRLAYMCYHVKIGAELGHTILCVVPEANKIQDWITIANHPDLSDKIKYYSFIDEDVEVLEKSGLLNQILSKVKLFRKFNLILKKATKLYALKNWSCFF